MKYLMILIILCAGCKSTKPNMTDSFPKGLEAVCMQQLQAAKASIESTGTVIMKKRGVFVYLRKGEKRIDGMWCWPEGAWWIGGETASSGSPVFIGCNPNTLGDVSLGVIYHEFKHYWLITNKGLHGHNPQYFPEIRAIGMSTNEVQL